MERISFFILVLILVMACSSGTEQRKEEKPKNFEMPQIPAVLTNPADRAVFLADHYWDKFDFSDTTYCSVPEITEQAFVNFIDLLDHIPARNVEFSIKSMLKKAESDSVMYAYFVKLYGEYLYNTDSPMRNEEYYIPVLESLLASDKVSDVMKIKSAKQLHWVKKNRIDSVANDFVYTDKKGRINRMPSIKAPRTLLFFYNPGCEMCSEALSFLKNSARIKAFVRDKQLVILAIYPDGDIDAWREHAADFPQEWLNGYDKERIIDKEELYDLKTFPAIYLLDEDKRVILKNMSAEQIETYYDNLIVECR